MELNSEKSKTEINKPDIYSYHDYRNFLRDWFDYLKQKRGQFSLRHLAKQAGISHSLLPFILNGTRTFSKKAMSNVLPLLDLSPTEQSYFKLLCTLGDTDDQEERINMLSKIHRFHDYRKLNSQEVETYKYLTNWYYVAIRELAAVPGFSLDPKWIQSNLKFKVPIGEINKATAFLLEHKFIEVTEDGKVSIPKKNLRCEEGVYRILMAKFHKEAFELATNSFDKVARQDRKIGGYALAIPKSRFEDIRKLLDELTARLEALQELSGAPEIVYYVAFAGFPLTEQITDKSRG